MFGILIVLVRRSRQRPVPFYRGTFLLLLRTDPSRGGLTSDLVMELVTKQRPFEEAKGEGPRKGTSRRVEAGSPYTRLERLV